MFCEECGKQIPDNSKFCDGCGAPVKSVETAEAPVEQSSYQAEAFYGEPQTSGLDAGRTGMVQEPRRGQNHGQSYGNTGYGQPYGGDVGYGRPHGGRGHGQPYGGDADYGQSYGGDTGYGRFYEGRPESEDKKKGSLQTVLIVVLGVVAVALIGVLIFLGIRTFGGKKDGGGESPAVVSEREETQEETSAEAEEMTEEAVTETTEAAPTAPTVPETTVPPTTEAVSEYILPTSNSAYLTEMDLIPLTKEQLRLARNEIYARHGRKFKDASLNEYFLSKSWYVPLIEPDHFNENVFNDYETANRKLIADYEKKMGY
ncbi:MAG: YARHG domain-containing protein [Lachnospiraceae bacterium]|nr:YARHG domain-containing protein [Lachnospiraceae bacterium]